MGISWTHSVEDRIKRLEGQQDRMQRRVQSLSEWLSTPRRFPLTSPVGGGSGAEDGDPAPPSRAVATRKAQPPLEFWVPPPIEGGQPLFSDRMAIKSRVDNLSTAVRSLSDTVQRLETIVNLLGQVVYIAVDPQAQPAPRLTDRLGVGAGATGNGSGDHAGAGAPGLGGLAGLLSGLLGGQLGGQQLFAGTAGSTETHDSEPDAGTSGHGGANDASGAADAAAGGNGHHGDGNGSGALVSSAVPGLSTELQQVTALLPLLEQALSSRLGNRAGAGRVGRLGQVIGSPAFQQLVEVLQQQRGTRRVH